MRTSPLLVLFAALTVGAVACGSDEPEPSAGQSGEAPVTETTEATTTTAELTTTTLPSMVVDIPDVSDLGLTWDEALPVNEVSGEVAIGPFNEFLVAEAPSTMVPEGTFDGLDEEEQAEAVEAAIAEAPFKTAAVYLGLEPDDPDTQMLRVASGGPEGFRVVVIQSNLEDDSVRAIRWEFTIQMQARADQLPPESTTTTSAPEEADATTSVPEETTTSIVSSEPDDLIPVVYTAVQTTQCQPGRGHQDFATGLCV
jgi:hypothetical protein